MEDIVELNQLTLLLERKTRAYVKKVEKIHKQLTTKDIWGCKK